MIYTLSKESRTEDPDCISNLPGSKDKHILSESSEELVRNAVSFSKTYYIRIFGVGSLNNFYV